MIAIDVPDTLPAVLTDPALLERALADIIDNAVRYSPPGRPARVEAGAFARRVHVRVIDQGPGIPDAEREHVLLPLECLADTRGTRVGLGLAVAQAFLTAIGATIEIDDTAGGGTTVIVTIPLAESPTSSQKTTVA